MVRRSIPRFLQSLCFTVGITLGATLLAVTSTVAQAEGSCSLPPLAVPLFDATPAAVVAATPVDSSAAPQLDEAGAMVAMEQIVACANSGDPSVSYSIFTERYLASLFADPSLTYLPAFELEIAEGVIQPDGTLQLDEVTSVTPLDDGRVEVVATISSAGATYTDTFVLAWAGDVWLIDDVTNFDPAP